MRNLYKILAIMCLSSSGCCFGEDLSCTAITNKISKVYGLSEKCFCSPSDLANVNVTLPKGLKLIAACHLFDPSKAVDINLAKEKVNLDEYDNRGSLPFGRYFFAGKLITTGKINYEGDRLHGNIFFTPQEPFLKSKTAFSKNFSEIEIVYNNYGSSESPKEIVIPAKFLSGSNIEAFAEIEIDGLEIYDWDSEDNGTRPVALKILKLGEFHERQNK